MISKGLSLLVLGVLFGASSLGESLWEEPNSQLAFGITGNSQISVNEQWVGVSLGPAIQMGYQSQRWGLHLEIQNTQWEEKEGTIQIQVNQTQALFWLKGLLVKGSPFSPYVQLGGGVYQEEVTSRIFEIESRDKSRFEPLVALSGGLHWNFYSDLFVDLDARYSYPLAHPWAYLSGGLRLGYKF